MAREARSKKPEPPPDTRSWKTTRELWNRASIAQVDLEAAGKKYDRTAIWKRIRKYAPEELQVEENMPKEIIDALEHDGYKQLVEIRRRMAVIPDLKNLGLVKDMAGQGTLLAMTAALEDLLVHPEMIPTSEKRLLSKAFLDMHLHLAGLVQDEGAQPSLNNVAAELEAERQRALEQIPEPYRELMGKKWDQEMKRQLKTRQAQHLGKINEQSSFGTTG